MKRFVNPFSRFGGGNKDRLTLCLEEVADLRRDVERLELDMIDFRSELDSFYKSTRSSSQVSLPPPPTQNLVDVAEGAAAVPSSGPRALSEAIPPRVKAELGEWAQSTIAANPPANFRAATSTGVVLLPQPRFRFKQRGE